MLPNLSYVNSRRFEGSVLAAQHRAYLEPLPRPIEGCDLLHAHIAAEAVDHSKAEIPLQMRLLRLGIGDSLGIDADPGQRPGRPRADENVEVTHTGLRQQIDRGAAPAALA